MKKNIAIYRNRKLRSTTHNNTTKLLRRIILVILCKRVILAQRKEIEKKLC